MPELLQSLLKQDIGHLRIIAEFWGVELESISADEAREELSASLLDAELIAELVDSLSPQAESALRALVEAEGRIPWPAFTRKYGDIREMGAAPVPVPDGFCQPAIVQIVIVIPRSAEMYRFQFPAFVRRYGHLTGYVRSRRYHVPAMSCLRAGEVLRT